jgi:hypothetical protein
MKSISLCSRTGLILAAAVGGTLVAAPPLCRAGDPAAPATPEVRAESTKTVKSSCCCASADAKQQKAHKKVTITGSHIPQTVRPKDANLVSASPIMVIDRKMIETSGAASLAGVLRKTAAGAH